MRKLKVTTHPMTIERFASRDNHVSQIMELATSATAFIVLDDGQLLNITDVQKLNGKHVTDDAYLVVGEIVPVGIGCAQAFSGYDLMYVVTMTVTGDLDVPRGIDRASLN